MRKKEEERRKKEEERRKEKEGRKKKKEERRKKAKRRKKKEERKRRKAKTTASECVFNSKGETDQKTTHRKKNINVHLKAENCFVSLVYANNL